MLILARQRIGASFGGAEGYVSMLATALKDRGAAVGLMAQRIGEDIPREGFGIIRAPARPINLWGVWSFSRFVRDYLARNPEEGVISFDRIPGVEIFRAGDGCHAAYMRAMGCGVLDRLSPKHRLLLSLERRMFAHPKLRLVIANSKMVADDIQREYDVPSEKIKVIYTGLAPAPAGLPKVEARRKLGLDDSLRVLLFAGHHYERKGLSTLLRALSIMDKKGYRPSPKRSWVLLVAGKGAADTYRLAAKGLGIDDGVLFLGPRDLSDYFAASDLFVLPTRYDPLARVCLESARAGLPVMTTRRNGFCEWLDESDGFILDRPTDAETLARMIQRALTLNLGETGRRLQSKVLHLTIERNAEEILSCLKESGGK